MFFIKIVLGGILELFKVKDSITKLNELLNACVVHVVLLTNIGNIGSCSHRNVLLVKQVVREVV